MFNHNQFKNREFGHSVWSECPPDHNDQRPFWFWDGESEQPELTTHQNRLNGSRSGWWRIQHSPRLPDAPLMLSPDTRWIYRHEVNAAVLKQALSKAVQQLSEVPINTAGYLWIGTQVLLVRTSALYSPFTQALSDFLNIGVEQKTQLAFELDSALRSEKLATHSQPFQIYGLPNGANELRGLLEIKIEQIWPDATTRPAQNTYFKDLSYSINEWLERHDYSTRPLPVRIAALRMRSPTHPERPDLMQPAFPNPVVLTIDHEAPSFLLLPVSSRNFQ
ncbi:hypothetical protein HX882_03185 [Pseudomonas gingeri]|uniref:Uncharacterized protein n=1 Tax=Pseudomonas gingeri TaxID=117681 RepID=A0A7Y8C161_9PSED|nr:hypothetical protein [Pseudomonas gingeri]NWB94892.1 hypothetical protein [Pseudomonas gingeri]